MFKQGCKLSVQAHEIQHEKNPPSNKNVGSVMWGNSNSRVKHKIKLRQ